MATNNDIPLLIGAGLVVATIVASKPGSASGISETIDSASRAYVAKSTTDADREIARINANAERSARMAALRMQRQEQNFRMIDSGINQLAKTGLVKKAVGAIGSGFSTYSDPEIAGMISRGAAPPLNNDSVYHYAGH